MIVFFDIGSTLIDGPPMGPARRLSEALGLGHSAVGELERLLFRSPSETAEDLAVRIAASQGLNAQAACSDLWNAQLSESYVLPGAHDAIADLKAAGIPRAYLSNIWPPFYACFRREFADEALNDRQFLSFQTG